jgi:hypothetical protein
MKPVYFRIVIVVGGQGLIPQNVKSTDTMGQYYRKSHYISSEIDNGFSLQHLVKDIKVSGVSPGAGGEAASLINKRKFRNEFSYEV